MNNLIKEAPSLTVTRMHSKFPRRRIDETVGMFGDVSKLTGPVLIVSDESFAHRRDLVQAVEEQQGNGRAVGVVFLRNAVSQVKQDHARMFNVGVDHANKLGLPYMTAVSSDLGEQLPAVLPYALRRLHSDPSLFMVGVAVEGVHDRQLLDRVLREGIGVVTQDNYAGILPLNTLAAHRLRPHAPNGSPALSERRFKQLDETALGVTEIDGKAFPLWGHEDQEPYPRLVGADSPMPVVLLDGKDHRVVRDPSKEVATHPHKERTRPLVAAAYRAHYNVSGDAMTRYVQEYLQVEAA